MANFPSIASPDFGSKESVSKAQIRSQFESGYVQSRPGHSRARRRWDLSWKMMSSSDYALLESFFIANQGGTFNWTHPETSTVYIVRFSNDSLDGAIEINGYRSVSLKIEEV